MNTLDVVFGIFAVVETMAHSRARPKVWLWRAVTWPVAHVTTLFGHARDARSNRVAGRLELEMVFISQCCVDRALLQFFNITFS